MENKKFDQVKYMREWQKENMKQVKASYKTEFVDKFKNILHCKNNLNKENRKCLIITVLFCTISVIQK